MFDEILLADILNLKNFLDSWTVEAKPFFSSMLKSSLRKKNSQGKSYYKSKKKLKVYVEA